MSILLYMYFCLFICKHKRVTIDLLNTLSLSHFCQLIKSLKPTVIPGPCLVALAVLALALTFVHTGYVVAATH